jgi:hypothetical protein
MKKSFPYRMDMIAPYAEFGFVTVMLLIPLLLLPNVIKKTNENTSVLSSNPNILGGSRSWCFWTIYIPITPPTGEIRGDSD